MLIREFADHINEIDRRGFLRGVGAAAVVGGVGKVSKASGWANGINPHDPQNWIVVAETSDDTYYLKPNILNSGYFQYYVDSKIRIVTILQKGRNGNFVWEFVVNPETKMYAHNDRQIEWIRADPNTVGGAIFRIVSQLPMSRGELAVIGSGKTPQNLLLSIQQSAQTKQTPQPQNVQRTQQTPQPQNVQRTQPSQTPPQNVQGQSVDDRISKNVGTPISNQFTSKDSWINKTRRALNLPSSN